MKKKERAIIRECKKIYSQKNIKMKVLIDHLQYEDGLSFSDEEIDELLRFANEY